MYHSRNFIDRVDARSFLNLSAMNAPRDKIIDILSDGGALQFECCDFSNRDLSGLDLSFVEFFGCSFAGASLAGANLSNTKWLDCIANNACFECANLTDARFHECNLQETRWNKSLLANALISESDLKFSTIMKGGISELLLIDSIVSTRFEGGGYYFYKINSSVDNYSLELLGVGDKT